MSQISDTCRKCSMPQLGIPPTGKLSMEKVMYGGGSLRTKVVYCDCPTGVQLQKEFKLNKLLGGKA